MRLVLLAAALRASSVLGDDAPPALVFTKSEVNDCTRIRTPQLMHNEHTGLFHVIARCCGPNMCSSKRGLIGDDAADVQTSVSGNRRHLDNDKDATVIMKTSADKGKTWGKLQTLSPSGRHSYSNGAGIYDVHRRRLVVQYNFIPRGSTKGAYNASLHQIHSDDDGKTWSTARDLTSFISKCQDSVQNTQLQSAGTKVQTPTGRLVFAGHDHSRSRVCVWYSDDGGESYKATLTEATNEVSIAVADTSSRTLYMNGRGGKQFLPNRAEYWSYDDGTTWSLGSRSEQTRSARSFETKGRPRRNPSMWRGANRAYRASCSSCRGAKASALYSSRRPGADHSACK